MNWVESIKIKPKHSKCFILIDLTEFVKTKSRFIVSMFLKIDWFNLRLSLSHSFALCLLLCRAWLRSETWNIWFRSVIWDEFWYQCGGRAGHIQHQLSQPLGFCSVRHVQMLFRWGATNDEAAANKKYSQNPKRQRWRYSRTGDENLLLIGYLGRQPDRDLLFFLSFCRQYIPAY